MSILIERILVGKVLTIFDDEGVQCTRCDSVSACATELHTLLTSLSKLKEP